MSVLFWMALLVLNAGLLVGDLQRGSALSAAANAVAVAVLLAMIIATLGRRQ